MRIYKSNTKTANLRLESPFVYSPASPSQGGHKFAGSHRSSGFTQHQFSHRKPGAGFTLLELLIYIAVLATVGVILSGTFIFITEGRVRQEARSGVHSELRFAMDRIKQDLKEATAITAPLGGEVGDTLTITVDEETVTYALSSGRLTRNAVNLTSTSVNITDLDFQYFTNLNISISKVFGTVQVAMTMEDAGTSGASAYSTRQTETFAVGQVFLYPARGTGTNPGQLGGCFVVGTKVKTPQGEVNIESIAIGQEVLGFDANEEVKASKVTRLFSKKVDEIIKLETDMGEVITTADHPFYVGNGIFTEVRNINSGDKIFDADFNPHVVLSYTIIKKETVVYNLEVNNTHTYFANGYAVHNKFWEVFFESGI